MLPSLAGTVLVRSGKPWQAQLETLREAHGVEPSAVRDDLAGAAEYICAVEYS